MHYKVIVKLVVGKLKIGTGQARAVKAMVSLDPFVFIKLQL